MAVQRKTPVILTEVFSYGKVNGKIMFTGVSDFTRVFPPVKVFCNGPWLFIGPSEHYHTTQTSKFNNFFFNGAFTMLNDVFK